MATAVDKAMNDGEHLLVQAGTGTGKSLGYLVPAILRASKGVKPDGTNRTVIATATLALQRQLVDHDLPAAVESLADQTEHPITYAVLKGRHNYICLDKFNRVEVDAADDGEEQLFQTSSSALAKQAKKLRQWVEITQTGDRDDYDSELDGRLWRSMSVSGRECVGASKCAWGEDCFAELARTTAHASDIVVTNHALLAIDILENLPILPDHDSVIIDEAHELVDRTTNALAGSLDVATMGRATGMARKFIQPSTHDRMMEVADDLGLELESYDREGTTTRIEGFEGQLLTALTAVRDVYKVAQAEMTTSSQDESDIAAQKQRAKATVKDVYDVAAELLSADEHSVTWIDVSRTAVLHHAPLSVAGFLGEALFGQHTIVLTSATLAVAGSMDSTAKAVGLGESGWIGLDVGSPFDYSKQGILYCPSHLPPPSSSGVAEEALDELGDLIDAAGGRTLSLFSSWRGVERAEEYLAIRFKGRDDRPLIVARKGDAVSDLVRRFRESPESSLLGTVSLWQGIDVPGNTCTLVTIDRIPFPRPDDPVMAARSARVDESGGSGFRSVSLPRAALLLAQGVGRLIRSTEDRGVVAVLDSRLANSGYGSTLRKSLPNLWWTTDKDSVISALERLDDSASDA
ncbi:MAG: DEAD/DEAH box helicase [Actinobacteria bacterium]|nr:DEAD/DEAH box helicase [Actinomycetota bacterium]MSX29834.1 DEAD/DEAH box helicase [Actinomycetota bacterium]MSX97868.1 DEAD/DEAH box helicase [Actinomycetota bacterium]